VPALANLRPVTPGGQQAFALACGQGPVLTVDGRAYQTSVSGTLRELSQYLPLRVRLCSPGGTLTLGAGRHTLTVAAGTFAVTGLSLASASPRAAAPSASRAATIRSWQPDQRQLSIGPGPASYLEVHQNYNQGWTAVLNGQPLNPVRLDGWQQGFVVPAGPGGAITLSFRPASSYHLALVVSAAAVALLLAIAAWSLAGRPGRRPGPDGSEDSGAALPLAGPPTPVPAADGAAADSAAAPRRRRAWLGVLGVTALIFVAGGPVALAVPALAWLAWPRPRWPRAGTLPVLAFAGLAASGLLAAAQPFGDGLLGPFGWPAQACALLALAAALTPAVTLPARRQPTQTTAAAEEAP
jgi:arabinofuranan 3-O-arabinosyltransferase